MEVSDETKRRFKALPPDTQEEVNILFEELCRLEETWQRKRDELFAKMLMLYLIEEEEE